MNDVSSQDRPGGAAGDDARVALSQEEKHAAGGFLIGTVAWRDPPEGNRPLKLRIETKDSAGRDQSVVAVIWGSDAAAKFPYKRGDRVKVVGDLRVDSYKKGERENASLEIHAGDGAAAGWLVEKPGKSDPENVVKATLVGNVSYVGEVKERPLPDKGDKTDRSLKVRRIMVTVARRSAAGERHRFAYPVDVLGAGAEEPLALGQLVQVQGEIGNRSYEGEGGEKRYACAIGVATWSEGQGVKAA